MYIVLLIKRFTRSSLFQITVDPRLEAGLRRVWLKDEQPLDTRAEAGLEIRAEEELVILEVEVEDEGRYECRVFTEYDKTSSSGLVTVLSEPPTITSVPNNIRNSVNTRDSQC